MPTNTYTGANNGTWATGGNWSLGHQPTTGEDVEFDTTAPLGPTIATTVLSVGYDVTFTRNFGNLSISGNLAINSGGTLSLSAVGGNVLLDNASNLTVAGTITGTTTLSDDQSTVSATSFTGAITAPDPVKITGTVHALTNTNGTLSDYSHITWAAAATLHLTGTFAIAPTSSTNGYPTTINADGDLLIVLDPDDIVLNNPSTINTGLVSGGTLIIAPAPAGRGSHVTLTGVTINGPNLATAFYAPLGSNVIGSPTVTGFGPAYKVGAGATQVGTYASTVTIPALGEVQNGVHFGPDGGLTGSGSAGRAFRTRQRGL